MKTVLFTFLIAVSTSCLSFSCYKQQATAATNQLPSNTANRTSKSHTKKSLLPQHDLLTRSCSFMPFADDPCNYAPARDSFC